ncbi:hypothetical protein AB0758_33205 [Tolypothrix bouteillei VB521301_2]|uniref:hypothetical protein n=1 Tax=Tolypothrix bouteillei TaxID=1246981 RepID=UPI0038B648EB
MTDELFQEIVSIARQLVNKRRQAISVIEVSNCYYAIATVEWVGGKFPGGTHIVTVEPG